MYGIDRMSGGRIIRSGAAITGATIIMADMNCELSPDSTVSSPPARVVPDIRKGDFCTHCAQSVDQRAYRAVVHAFVSVEYGFVPGHGGKKSCEETHGGAGGSYVVGVAVAVVFEYIAQHAGIGAVGCFFCGGQCQRSRCKVGHY